MATTAAVSAVAPAQTDTSVVVSIPVSLVPKAFEYLVWLKKMRARPGRMVKVSQTVPEVGLK